MKISYDIREYNQVTRKYTELAHVEAPSKEQAKEIYIKQSGWKKTKDTMLFVVPPVCR
mgnify:CR=1 FL=1|tara:strand:- start:1200 stop:1373 length:174 start_codon:yes stop_codon:yes gene_type:complete